MLIPMALPSRLTRGPPQSLGRKTESCCSARGNPPLRSLTCRPKVRCISARRCSAVRNVVSRVITLRSWPLRRTTRWTTSPERISRILAMSRSTLLTASPLKLTTMSPTPTPAFSAAPPATTSVTLAPAGLSRNKIPSTPREPLIRCGDALITPIATGRSEVPEVASQLPRSGT